MKQNGFTLIELLVAITLTSIILYTSMQIFFRHKESWRTRLAILQLDNEANFIIDTLTTDIKQAGYIGCAKLSTSFNLFPRGQVLLNANNFLTGSRDTLISRYASTRFAVLLKNMNNLTLYLNSSPRFHADEWVIISDCTAAEIFQIKTVNFSQGMQKITPIKKLQHSFRDGAEISKLFVNEYHFSKNQIYLQPLLGRKIYLSKSNLRLHLHFYYQNKGMIFYRHRTIAEASLIGIALQLTYNDKKWFAYVPT